MEKYECIKWHWSPISYWKEMISTPAGERGEGARRLRTEESLLLFANTVYQAGLLGAAVFGAVKGIEYLVN